MQVDLELYRREVRVSANPLVRLSALDLGPERPDKTIVFLHGFGGHARQWRHQLQHFSDTQRVIALDLRGHGFSDRPADGYDMPHQLADLDAALIALGVVETADPQDGNRQPAISHRPLARFVLVGHSFGGAIASEYAAAHQERVEKLILIATAGEFRLAPNLRLALSLPTLLLNAAFPFVRGWLQTPPAVMQTMHRQAVSKWNGWSLFPDLRVPTLVIRGHRDRVFAKTFFEEVARAIPGAEDVDVGASGHMVMLERRDAVDRAIERFVFGAKATLLSAHREKHEQNNLMAERPWLAHYDEGVPPTLGFPRIPLHRFLRSAARRFPLHTALLFEGRRLTYRRLNRESSRFANALVALGIHKGDRILLLLPNLPQTVITFYGALKAGAIVVFATPLSEPEELQRQIRESGARMLITLTRNSEAALAALKHTGLEHLVFTNVKEYMPVAKRIAFALTREVKEGHRLSIPLSSTVHLLPDMLRGQSPRSPDAGADAEPDDLALLQYTGGTSGQPKGVMLTHRNLVANTLQTRHWIPDMREGKEVFLSVVPFSHVYGMMAALCVPVVMGATMIVLPTFDTRQVLKNIRRYRPTLFPGVPTMFVALSNFPGVRKFGVSSIRACISGAAPLPVEVQEAFEKLTRGRLVEGYGLTEAGPVTHANPFLGRRKVGSIGIPFPSTEARVVDLAAPPGKLGRELTAGQIGELAVRGPQVMRGYWQSPEATAAVLTPDGWLLTGDVARMDAEGYFTIIARKKEMILAGEYQVYPRDVEEVLYEHPKVKEVAVVGIQPPRWPFQRVKAYVVLREGETASEEELIALCRRRLEEYAVPWKIEFRKELPRTFVGKILRRLLVEEDAS